MKKKFIFRTLIVILLLSLSFGYANDLVNDSLVSKKKQVEISKSQKKSGLSINATSNLNPIYCPQTSIKIVDDVTITHDPTDTGAEAIYIQISTGFVAAEDQLTLTGFHPTIITSWDAVAGKLKLFSPANIPVSYFDFISAIKDVVFSNSTATPSGTRNFSISLGLANFLPSTQHYYLFVPNIGITWANARIAADASTYFGLKGYLATILSLDEAKFAGKQAAGSGWIGGSDAEKDDVWKWVTGPETGTVFWNGGVSGSSPNFAFWNTGEPNNFGGTGENYVHITQPGVGELGSWNDLTNSGSTEAGNPYQPKGYIVEYGGTIGDPTLQIATFTSIIIPTITAKEPKAQCDSGTFTLEATTTSGTIDWYNLPIGGSPFYTGTSYTTPTPLTNTTIYYLQTSGCSGTRTKVTATINKTPDVPIVKIPAAICESGKATLEATTNIGTISWYDVPTGGTPIWLGTIHEITSVNQTITYYAEAKNGDCANSTRTPLTVKVYPLPVVTDENLILCESQKLTLDAKLSGLKYEWNTGAISQTIDITSAGEYSVKITSLSPENCSNTKKFHITEHFIPIIKIPIDVNETTVTINLENPETYFEYSIDGIIYQDSNIFYNVLGGLQTAYVRELNCSSENNLPFVVIIAPKFFTPNNDGFNDVWEIKGMEKFLQAKIYIFDQYGKLIKTITSSNPNWDGTYNKLQLPASDYWYVLKIDESSPEKKGHFSLKR